MSNLIVRPFPETVKKAVEVINARGPEFVLLDKKILNILMAAASRHKDTEAIHRISLRTLADYLLMSGHESMDRIVQSLERLCHGEIEIRYRDEVEGEVVINCHYLSTKRTVRTDGWLEFAFDQVLMRFLHNPKVYSAIQLPIVRKFTSPHSLHLYEVMQGKVLMFSPTWQLTLEEAVAAFSILPGSSNARLDIFKTRVVGKAIEEINQFAEFDVGVDYEKSGRGGKVTGITFTATTKTAGRLAIAADARRAGRKSGAARDRDTVDLFSGVSDGDDRAPELRVDTLEQARRIIGEGGDGEVLRQEWSREFKGNYGDNPDDKFLAWLRIKRQVESDKDLDGVDVDAVFKTFLLDGK